MPLSFNDPDVRRLAETLYVLDGVKDASAMQDIALPALGRLVGCEVGVLTVFDPHEPSETSLLWPRDHFALRDFEGYTALLGMHPFVKAQQLVAAEPALRISDLCSLRQWHSTGLYRDQHRQLGADDQLACTIPDIGPGITAVIMSRQGSGFSPRDRDLFAIARPHIFRTVHRALRSPVPYRALHLGSVVHWVQPKPVDAHRSPLLTPREEQVMAALALGWTSARIARSMQVSPRTVEKHVEHIHRKLAARSSLEAVQRWQEGGGGR